MRKRVKIFSVILTVALLIGIPVVYFQCIKTDKNGFTAWDIKKGIHTGKSFFSAINKEDKETVKRLYSEEAMLRRGSKENWEQFISSVFEVTHDNVIVDYEPDKQVGELSSIKYQYGKESEIMYLTSDFDLVYREKKESVGAWIDGYHYESLGIYLIKIDGKWKILDWGY